MYAAKTIKEARLLAGISQAALAKRASTAQSAIAKYETGVIDPRFETLRRLVKACGFELDISLARPKIDPHDASLMDRTLAMTPEERLISVRNATRLVHELQGGLASR